MNDTPPSTPSNPIAAGIKVGLQPFLRLHTVIAVIRYCALPDPLFWLSVVLSLLSSSMEVIAIMSLRPLVSLANTGKLDESDPIVRALQSLHFDVSVPNLLLLFLGLFALRISLHFLTTTMNYGLGRRTHWRLGSAALQSVLTTFPVSEIEEKSIGHFNQIAGEQAARVANMVLNLVQVITMGVLAAMYFSYVIAISPTVAASVIGYMGMTLLALSVLFVKSHRLGFRMVNEGKTVTTVFVDAINGLRAVHSFRAEMYAANEYRRALGQYMRTQFLIETINIATKTLPVVMLFIVLAIYIVLHRDTVAASLDVAFVLSVAVALMRFFPAVGVCLTSFMRALSDTKAAQDVIEIVEHVPSNPLLTAEGRLEGPVVSLEIEGVTFGYRQDKTVIRDFSMRFTAGKSYAFCGPSGAGKSTLADLIMKFYSPWSGRILVNGTDIASIKTEDWRKSIIICGQREVIFNDTVMNNLCLGQTFDKAAILDACRDAAILDVIEALPDGFDTVLNYQGSNLSGGQKQRLGIARALLREPQVLILDESTNALDDVSKSDVIRGIQRRFKDRILLYITHDPTIVERAEVLVQMTPCTADSPDDPA